MAKATPVNAAPVVAEQPAPAADILMEPAAPLAVKKTDRAVVAPSADPAELAAMVEAAQAEGKSARVAGNAVRVDH